MLYALEPHANSVCDAVTGITAFVTRRASRLVVRYIIHGNIAELRIPPHVAAERTDELWQHTCCEVFIRADEALANEILADDPIYYEFNCSPSTQWAAYRFSGYRAGMAQAEVAAPAIATARNAEHFELQATIDCATLPLADKKWRLGVAAVIEEMNGRQSYWSLAHPPGKPDFHHAHGFVVELAA